MEKVTLATWIILVCGYICPLEAFDVKELDEIFKDAECVEGKFLIDDSKPVLIKTGGYVMAKSPQKDQIAETHILVDIQNEKESNKNSLMLINELATFNKIEVEFILKSEEGEPHDRTFVVRLNLGKEAYYGTAKTIKEAKRAAASDALVKTMYERPPPKKTSDVKEVNKLTPTVQLNNIANKLGLKVEYIRESGDVIEDDDLYDITTHNYISLDSTRSYLDKLNDSLNYTHKDVLRVKEPDLDSKGPFMVRVNVGTHTFKGVGHTVQAARHQAAEKALEHLRKMSLQDADACLKAGEECNKLATKSPISLVYEIAQKRKLPISFDIIGESGPAHKKEFVMRCKVGEIVTESEGSSKKAAKKRAAEKMLDELSKIEPLDAGSSIRVNVPNASKKKKKKKNKNKITRPSQGIVDKMIDSAANGINNVISYFSDESNDDSSGSLDSTKPNKHELLRLANQIGIKLDFSSFQGGDEFSSTVSINTEPSYVCYNKGSTKDLSEENAALSALKFIKHVGLDNIIIPLKSNKGTKPKIVLDAKQPVVDVKKI